MTKTEQVKTYVKHGDIQSALSVLKSFRYGFSKEEHRTIQIAYESMTGHSRFYESIGIDTKAEIQKATCIVKRNYSKENFKSNR